MQPVVYAQPQTVVVQQPVVYQQPVYHESNQEEALIAGMMIGGMMSRPMGCMDQDLECMDHMDHIDHMDLEEEWGIEMEMLKPFVVVLYFKDYIVFLFI